MNHFSALRALEEKKVQSPTEMAHDIVEIVNDMYHRYDTFEFHKVPRRLMKLWIVATPAPKPEEPDLFKDELNEMIEATAKRRNYIIRRIIKSTGHSQDLLPRDSNQHMIPSRNQFPHDAGLHLAPPLILL